MDWRKGHKDRLLLRKLLLLCLLVLFDRQATRFMQYLEKTRIESGSIMINIYNFQYLLIVLITFKQFSKQMFIFITNDFVSSSFKNKNQKSLYFKRLH